MGWKKNKKTNKRKKKTLHYTEIKSFLRSIWSGLNITIIKFKKTNVIVRISVWLLIQEIVYFEMKKNRKSQYLCTAWILQRCCFSLSVNSLPFSCLLLVSRIPHVLALSNLVTFTDGGRVLAFFFLDSFCWRPLFAEPEAGSIIPFFTRCCFYFASWLARASWVRTPSMFRFLHDDDDDPFMM